jgi:hypothetical protein
MMKNIYLMLAAVTLSLAAMSSCSDSDYTDKYSDPSKTNTVTVEKLMTGVFYAGKDYTFNSYTRIYRWDYSFVGKFSQTLGFLNSPGRYYASESYYEDRWDNFYKVLAQYRVLQNAYSQLSSDSTEYKVFDLLARIFVYDHLSQITQCWGYVPFTKAGYIYVSGDISSSKPSYDDDIQIFKTILSDLKSINTELAGMSPSSLTTSMLTAQDYINGGNLNLWRRYCNSLRLRIAMLVADQGDMASEGRSAIREMLADTTAYPMVSDNSQNIKVTPDLDGFNYSTQYKSGWEETSGYLNKAPQAMVDALKGDPRMPVIFDANSKGDYVGIDTHDDYNKQDSLIQKANSENYYCAYDSATFSRNQYLPGNIITSAEVSFLRAEAFQKGYAVGGSARDEFIKGMKQSTDWYFKMNSTASYRKPLTEPSAGTVEKFAEDKWDAAANKLEAICTQEWLNYGFLQTTQAWSVYRRTGYPELYFTKDETNSNVPEVPVRLKYPAEERNSNTSNYNAVKANDTFYTKLFWEK